MSILRRVKVYNFRSIREVDVELKPLTIFVGPNAAGKSRFCMR
ncbi:MAG: AAA family ATPase [Candidatus Baldrarchaeia archaeon]